MRGAFEAARRGQLMRGMTIKGSAAGRLKTRSDNALTVLAFVTRQQAPLRDSLRLGRRRQPELRSRAHDQHLGKRKIV
jgi:hypothetical protein